MDKSADYSKLVNYVDSEKKKEEDSKIVYSTSITKLGDLQKVYVGRDTYSDGNKYEAILVYTNSDSDSDEKTLYCKLDGLTFKNGKLQGADNYRMTSDGDVDDMLQLK
ncbi:hypothetical protein [Limosilactobacillus fermentum]|uniref:hypothetical protein n=1 Tax=Limosilactobacillus fermentum TaxID=1613 RepID=UPI0021A8DA89|nr:hypothetical protein [Limosilactobacillus fermentum]